MLLGLKLPKAEARGTRDRIFLREFMRFGSLSGFLQFARVGSDLVTASLVGPNALATGIGLTLLLAPMSRSVGSVRSEE